MRVSVRVRLTKGIYGRKRCEGPGVRVSITVTVRIRVRVRVRVRVKG